MVIKNTQTLAYFKIINIKISYIVQDHDYNVSNELVSHKKLNVKVMTISSSVFAAFALQCLHSRDIAHMDLKPQNILLSSKENPTLKIAGSNIKCIQ